MVKSFVWFTAFFFTFLALWVTVIRPWARRQTMFAGFFALIEPIELALWSKSESILWARALALFGGIYELLIQISAIDITPFIGFLPEEYRGYVSFAIQVLPLVVSAVGFVQEKLRRDVTKPIQAVAVSSTASPEVQAAVAKIDATNVVAVDAIKSAA